MIGFRLGMEDTPDTLGRERDRVDGDSGRVENGVTHRGSDGIDDDFADGLRPEGTGGLHRLHEEDLHGRRVVGPEDPVGPKARMQRASEIVEKGLFGEPRSQGPATYRPLPGR